MKISSLVLAAFTLMLSPADAFAPSHPRHFSVASPATTSQTASFMFGGAGEGVPAEDDPEEQKKMEAAAKSMGMSVDEYKLGVTARIRLTNELNGARLVGGNKDKVAVERDGNNPPRHLEIVITDAGKALGKDGVSKELVSALKAASEASKKARADAQKDMMQFISEEMKKMGKA